MNMTITANALAVNTPLPSLLCVDDQPMVGRAIDRLFRGLFNVTVVTDPTRAVELLTGGNVYDVIVADQQMPKMLGVEVLEIAADVLPMAGRILLTGFSEAQAVVESVNRANVNWFVTKPWDSDELREKVSRAAQASQLSRSCLDLSVTQPMKRNEPLRDRSGSPNVTNRTVMFVAMKDALQGAKIALPTGSVGVYIPSFDDAVGAIERSHSVPDVIVISINVQSENDRSDLERLKATFPGVVLVIVCDTSFAKATISLVNSARPFRFLASPTGQKLLARAVDAALVRAAQLQSNPILIEAQLPAETSHSVGTQIGARFKRMLSVFTSRFSVRQARRDT